MKSRPEQEPGFFLQETVSSASAWEVLKQQLEDFEPDLLLCASKGGAYVTALWEEDLWRGPTVLINRLVVSGSGVGGGKIW